MNFWRRVPVGGGPAALLAAGLLAHGNVARGETPIPPVLPSQVSITANVPTAYAAAGIPGSFVITRTAGDSPGAITVNYQVSGKAVAGQDYQTLKGTKYIAGTKTRVKITVHPFDVSSGTIKGVRVTLLPGDGYSLSSEVKATVKIVQ